MVALKYFPKMNYPYYVPVRFESGVLKKLFKEKKFKSKDEAVKAMMNKYKYLGKLTHNHFLDTQNAILEYTKEYEAQIISIFTNGIENIIVETN